MSPRIVVAKPGAAREGRQPEMKGHTLPPRVQRAAPRRGLAERGRESGHGPGSPGRRLPPGRRPRLSGLAQVCV